MRAIDVMSAPVYVVAPADNVAYARRLMLKHRVSRLPVMEGEELRGILTKKDIAFRLRQTEPAWRRRPIDRIPVSILMAQDPITVTPETGIRAVAATMLDRDISGCRSSTRGRSSASSQNGTLCVQPMWGDSRPGSMRSWKTRSRSTAITRWTMSSTR